MEHFSNVFHANLEHFPKKRVNPEEVISKVRQILTEKRLLMR